MSAAREQKQAGVYNPLPTEEAGAAQEAFHRPPLESGNGKKKPEAAASPAPYELLDVRALLSYEEQPGAMQCGDAVLEEGEIAMLFGYPSTGKAGPFWV